ncbi:hypothetical protein [Aliivibrio finisterrensis]|uniref:Uncharacterized protein n=1 Tax=Aliivibrio finisterrensis TaxID=511998 RepID=A0A6N6RWQ4_9GAMM|nr:hypothetical protein [Aliivibrio finisterrensis]KAB2826175.1 hypothetical protein F8B77_02900 [Aliivibrio finisterrensis]
MKLQLAVLTLISSISSSVMAYELSPKQPKSISESQVRLQGGASPVWFGKWDKNCDEECDTKLIIGGYQHRFEPSAKLETVAQFKDRSFAIVSQMYQKKNGKYSSRNEYHFIQGGHSERRVDHSLCESSQATGFNYQGELLCLNENTLDIYSAKHKRSIKLPKESDFGAINNNLAGTVSIAYVNTEERRIRYTNLHNLEKQKNEAWEMLSTRLHDRSDRRNIIATYPINRSRGLVTMYEYVNPFNKGLNLYYFEGDKSARRIVSNSEEGNFGFNPEVFVYGNQYAITAEDPKENKRHTYLVNPDEMSKPETYVNDMSTKSKVDFLAGYGLMYNNWEATQSIGDDVETDYNINASFLHTVYLQARLMDTQASLKYLTNQAEGATDGKNSEAVSMLTGLVDFNSFFEGADTLRLKMDWTKTDGTATFKSSNSSYCLAEGCSVKKGFSTEYKSIETLVLSEGGMYMGFSYSNYAMPSAVGFQRNEDSSSLLGVAFDEDFEQTRYMFVIGRDEAAYGARYETNYNRFYLTPKLGIGVAQYDISSAAEKIARNGESGSITGTYGLAITGGLDFGYIYQRRWAEASGLGYSIQAGVRANIDWSTNGILDAGDDDIYFDYNRFDLMWGPYIQFNAMF